MIMEYVIELLKKEREALLSAIKGGDSDKIKSKVEVEQAVYWLGKIRELGFDCSKEKYEFIKLPDIKTGFSEYHIMNDGDSDNIDDWIEIKDETGYPITLIFDDVLISRRPK